MTERTRRRRYTPTCTCGHAWSSHRQDPDDVWVTERCKTCRCAGFDNRDDSKRQGKAPPTDT